jgi:hypothetical protein
MHIPSPEVSVTSTRRSLRVETPVLEPDDALVARLAADARHSVAPAGAGRRRRLGDWRVALATAGIVVLTTGAAYATGVLGPFPRLNPLDRPPAPNEETEPVPVPSHDDAGTDTELPVGRPTDLPTEGTGAPSDRPTGQPSGVPTGKPAGLPSGHPTGPPSGLPTEPPGQPSGLPTDEPPRPTGKPSATPPRPALPPTQRPVSPQTGAPNPQSPP